MKKPVMPIAKSAPRNPRTIKGDIVHFQKFLSDYGIFGYPSRNASKQPTQRGNMPRTLRVSEELTRKEMIDPQLEKAGWYLRDHTKVKIEIPVDGYDGEPWNGVSDYTLYRENGEVLAAVEAKKTAVDVRLAESQPTHYVTKIEKRHLETADLYEPPLDMFGADAVERWFTESEIREVLELAQSLQT
jgi:hypothetical protein